MGSLREMPDGPAQRDVKPGIMPGSVHEDQSGVKNE